MGSSLQNILHLAIAGAVASSVVACNLQIKGGTWGGAPPQNNHAQAACAGTICHFGEYCSEQNVCTVGCKTDETCGPLEGCVKAAGQAIGTCQERQEPAGDGTAGAGSSDPAAPASADPNASPSGTATLGWGNKDKPPGRTTAPRAPTCTKSTRACGTDLDCGVAAHCAKELCYPNEPGCPCENSLHCGAGAHCTDEICWESKPGVPCSTPLDCGATGHCTDGMCYENASGSPCSGPLDCGSSSACVKGTCN